MENCEIKNCRLCNKEGFIFCDINHEVIQKLSNFIPNLINVNDETLMHVTQVCTTCYQTVKTIVYNIENIMDTQKILRIENSMRPVTIKKEKDNTQSVEDITKKYTNIKVRKISICPAPNTSSQEQSKPVKSDAKETSPKKLVVVEALPDSEMESPPKKTRTLMCITCSQKFTDSEMQTHIKSCKASPNNLKCFCGKVLSSKKDLALHVYSQHKQNKQNHVCKICQKSFPSLFYLQNHMATHNSPKSNLKGTLVCHYCKGKFLNIDALMKHLEVENCGRKKASET